MKKFIFAFIVCLSSITAKAQYYDAPFSVYEPVYPSTNGSSNWVTEYEMFRPNINTTPRRERMQEQTVQGYYKKGYNWYTVPLRIGFTSDRIIVLKVKNRYDWSSVNKVPSMVGNYDSNEIRDNFTFKCNIMGYGYVYF
jgi:hypothetical protein